MFEAAISSLLKEVTHSKPNIIFSFIQFVDRFQTAGLCIKYLTLAGDEDTPPGRLPNLAGSQDVNRAAWSRIASKISNLINVSLNLRCLRITHAERAMEACPSLHDVISQCKNLSELRLTDPTSSSSTIYTIRSIQSIRSPLRVLELKELHPTGYCLHPLTLLTNFVDTLEELYVYAKITSRWITVPEVWPKVSTGVISREPNILVAALEQAFPNLRELKVDGGAEIGDFSEYTRDNRTHIFSNWTELDHIQGVFTDIWHLGLRGVCVDSLSNENTPRGNRIAQYLPNIMEQTRPRKLNLTLSKYIWPSLNQGIQRLKTLVVSASWDNDPQAMFRSLVSRCFVAYNLTLSYLQSSGRPSRHDCQCGLPRTS